MHQIYEHSNTAAKSNASIRENGMGDIGMIKGGLLAWKLCRKGRRVIGDVADQSGISSGLGVYRRRRGGRNSEYKAHRCKT
jgi:hypothetical protein